jgi:Transposase
MPVMIGVDPHKASHTAAALDEHGQLLDRQRVPATLEGYEALGQWAGQWQERRWAVEGADGLGRALAQRLVGDGDQVLAGSWPPSSWPTSASWSSASPTSKGASRPPSPRPTRPC